MATEDILKKYDDPDFKRCEKCVVSKESKGSELLFLKAVTVWIKKPHVVNRRLCGSKLVYIQRLSSKAEVNEFLREFGNDWTFRKQSDQPLFEDLTAVIFPYTVIIRELIPKSEFFPKVHEILIYDKASKTVTFIPIRDGAFNGKNGTIEIQYSVQLRTDDSENSQEPSNEIVMRWLCDHEEPEVSKRQLSSKWLSTVLLEKLVSWSHIKDISTSITSLQLIDVDEYQKTYSRLKNDYGKDLVKNWTETTDPQKFVYEDIAIASYLLLIWEEDRRTKNLKHKQTFVDLGCGNGLLVYILTKEGHKGLGIDLRKRKIWDTFGPDIDLQEMTITPSGDHLYPDYDWLIGNHSDELTPWIPVISARSSYNSCLFVLPCCHHDFVGKFTATEKGKSKYATYLTYVKEVISVCGFKPECDTLRIPSTKRICYIGRNRTYNKNQEKEADKKRQDFIDDRFRKRQNIRVSFSKDSLADESATQDQGLHLADSSSNQKEKIVLNVNNLDSGFDSKKCLPGVPLDREEHFSISSSSSEKRSFPTSCDDPSIASDNEEQRSPPCCKKTRLEVTTNLNDDEKQYTGKKMSMPNITSGNSNGKEIGTDVSENSISSPWVSDFLPRQESRVRNCQRVPGETKIKIVEAVFNLVRISDPDNIARLDCGRTWCKGGSVPLGKVVSLFDKSVLQELKSECGGLQTLLRNHSHVFQVTGGKVQLRDFTKSNPWEGRNPHKSKDKQRNTLKTTLCWFNSHHPDGCPKIKDECLFAHGADDLRDKVLNS